MPSADGEKGLTDVADTEQTDNPRYLRAKAICHIMHYELNLRHLRANKVLRVLCVKTKSALSARKIQHFVTFICEYKKKVVSLHA